VFSAAVVEAVDVLEEGLISLVSGGSILPPDQFGFQGLEESLDSGIVVTVALAAHRHHEAKVMQPLLIIMRTILDLP
jgi:CRISPR/Cas system-associated endonuclease Cas3-HD